MSDFIVRRDGRQIPFEEEKNLTLIIPICSCCNKVYIDNKSWQQLELSHSKYSAAALSHGLCPKCFEDQRTEFMKFKSTGSGLTC